MISNTSGAGSSKMTAGFRSDYITLRLFLNLYAQALAHRKNPFRAAADVQRFSLKRKAIQGYGRIPRFIERDGKYHFAEHIPGFPSEQFNAFMEGELLRLNGNPSGKPLLNTLIFSITNRCSLRCSHCFEWDNIGAHEHLCAEDLMVIMEKLKTLGLTHIQFGGGEPLLRLPDLINLIGEAKDTMDCWVLTSGFGLTPEVAQTLAKAGLTGASISLDHWDETEHNRFRNHPESFRWVKEAVRNCRDAGILVTLAFCATRQFATRDNVQKYMELAKAWGAGFVKILDARQTGRFRGKDVRITPEQVKMLSAFYLETYTNSAYRNYPIVMYPGFDQRQVGCLGAGNRYLYIDSRGEIHSCPFCHGSAGNAVQDSMPAALVKLREKGCPEFRLCDY
jgi:MoaA/NifB/PqqE/SkfB family radical SAM enzyme